MTGEKILFVKHYTSTAKFVLNDFEILGKRYNTFLYDSKIKSNFFSVFSFLHQFFYLLFKIHGYKLIYIWFADYHSFLPVLFSKLFNKKSVIAAGGYDATYIPEIDMGVFTKATLKRRLRCFCAEYSLKKCSLILPVDKSLIENENTYIYSDKKDKPVLKDGIKNMIKEIRTPFKTIHLGYDSDIFKNTPGIKKERAVVSAGFIMNDNEYRRKGFDVLTECAKRMTDTKFILIGLNDNYMETLSRLKYDNLELYSKVSYEKLIELYSRAKVYSQLSLFEGMPSAVCEAMLCECIPVGSDVNGIPDIIGDCGIIVKEKKIETIVQCLETALKSDNDSGLRARKRIMEIFPLKKRETELMKVVREIIS